MRETSGIEKKQKQSFITKANRDVYRFIVEFRLFTLSQGSSTVYGVGTDGILKILSSKFDSGETTVGDGSSWSVVSSLAFVTESVVN